MRKARRKNPAVPESGLGTSAFHPLRAEDESWLMRCFVPPPEFERVAGSGSVVIFGGVGTGKTALAKALAHQHAETRGEGRLVVWWRPAPLISTEKPSEWVYNQTTRLLDACAVTLAEYLIQRPEVAGAAPEWARARVVWFLHRFTAGAPHLRLGHLLEADSAGAALVRDWLSATPEPILYEDATPDQVIAELVITLHALGLEGIWVITDGLERWVQVDEESITRATRALLDTLMLFEHPGLAFKLFVPSRMEPALSRASGLARRRLDAYRLRWDEERLQRIVEARLALALGTDRFTLADLCTAPDLTEWLRRVGAHSPREWLDQVSPLVEKYLQMTHPRPLTAKEWRAIRQRHPPRLYLDDQGRHVVVGGREIPLDRIPAKAYEMLKYLYARAGDVVSRQELYYRVYRGLDYVPRSPADSAYEAPKEYESLIDTAIWRLRQAIEPDPANPVLLVTVRGHGVRLVVRW